MLPQIISGAKFKVAIFFNEKYGVHKKDGFSSTWHFSYLGATFRSVRNKMRTPPKRLQVVKCQYPPFF